MKTTQAWTWLVAGVLAAGINASYHDGGLQWAHRIADRVVEHGSMAVLALDSGRPDLFLTEARMAMARDESASCRLATALARIQTVITRTSIARSETGFARFETMTAREEAQLVRGEAFRAKAEAYRAKIEAQAAAQAACVRVPVAVVAPVNVRVPVVCPRLRVNIPRPPMIQMDAPVIVSVGSGPV